MKTTQKSVRERVLRAAAAFVASITASLVAASCGGTSSSPGTDSNTHWLDQCSKDADCGKLSCRCGVCTRECTAGSECTDLGASATCGAVAACPTAVRYCVRASTQDGAGGNGGGGASNLGGGPGAGGLNDAGGSSGSFSVSCSRDSDCVAANVTCCGACGRPTLADKIALNVAAADSYQASLCANPVPCGKCASEPGTITALCRAGQCVLEDLASSANCTNDQDCVVEPKDCCFCSADMAKDSYFVAINSGSGYSGAHCVAAGECSVVCSGQPDAGTVAPVVTAFCGYGYCSLVPIGSAPP